MDRFVDVSGAAAAEAECCTALGDGSVVRVRLGEAEFEVATAAAPLTSSPTVQVLGYR